MTFSFKNNPRGFNQQQPQQPVQQQPQQPQYRQMNQYPQQGGMQGGMQGMQQYGNDAATARLLQRHQEQFKSKDGRGGKTNTLIDYSQLPEGVGLWYARPNTEEIPTHILEILSFEVGPDMPLRPNARGVLAPVSEEGDLDYLVDVDVHRRVGELQQDFICPRKTFNLPCPICSFMDANRLDKDDWSKLRTYRTVFYLVWVRSSPKLESMGVQIWPVSHFHAEEKFDALARMPIGGGFRIFSHLDHGDTVSFQIKTKGNNNIEYLAHQLTPRQQPIPQHIRNQIFPLDQVLVMHPKYEDMEKAFFGTLKTLGNKQQPPPQQGTNFQGNEAGNYYNNQHRMEDDVPFDLGSNPQFQQPQNQQFQQPQNQQPQNQQFQQPRRFPFRNNK